METLFLDAETYYDKEYSLQKMTPVEYILDPRFEMIGLAVKHGWPNNNQTPYWIEGPDVPKFFAGIDPDVTHVVTHNQLFDGCIFAWRYNFVPKLMTCTLSVARAVLGHILKSLSLKSVALHLNIGVKGEEIHQAMGMHLADLQADPEFYKKYVAYGLNDAELCAGIYDKLVRSKLFPTLELLVLDMVLRCGVNPKFLLDGSILAEHLAQVKADKQLLLSQAMLCAGVMDKSDVMSNEKFAQRLRDLGIEPPMKISKTTGQPTYAFAKTDAGLTALEEHEDPRVQYLVGARLGNKSTLEETRTERMLSISRLEWPAPYIARRCLTDGEGGAWMPIPLKLSGAHTHRLSGDWKLNAQNFGRKSRIRRALIVPVGHSVVTGDAAQIEARGVATICGQTDLVEQFAKGEDVYASFASDAFGRPINKKDNPGERFVGKVNVLQLGYGSGWRTLQNAIRVQSKAQLGHEIKVSDEDAIGFVDTYRRRYNHIPGGWNVLNEVGIPALESGNIFEFGPCKFEQGAILLPNGLRLHYPNLRRVDREWWFDNRHIPNKLYGGKLLENIMQALARIVIMDAGVRIQKRVAELALQVHDELCYVVPDEQVFTLKQIMNEEMCKRPSWMPEWPLAAEINSGKTYGDCK